MTTPNIELLGRVIAQITEHPESWDQAQWWDSCGTSGCIAGWAVHLSGEAVDTDSIAARARELLGLDNDALFSADNTLDAIKVWRQVLAGERVVMSGANLFRANLFRANLSGANLSGAKLSGAALPWANLSGAKLFRARGNADTVLPVGWVVSDSGCIMRAA